MLQIDAWLFKSFTDTMPYGVCLVDLQGTIIYWNSAAESVTGYLGQEVLGRAYRGDLLVHCTNNRVEVQCPIKEALRDGKAVAAELFLRHKRGHRIPVRVFAFPLRTSTGEVSGVGEMFYSSHGERDLSGWGGHSDRGFEMATGLPAIEESREQLHSILRSRLAPTSALILIEMSEQLAILQHGGTALLHQAIRVLAKTVEGLLPTRNYVGCWTDWRLIAIVPECTHEMLEMVKTELSSVGSSCAVKWWGDRVVIGIRASMRYIDISQTADQMIEGLEQDLKDASGRKE